MIRDNENNTVRIIQAPGLVAITYEVMHDTRIIPLDGRAQDTLLYQATMDDPATFTRPWTVQLEFKRTSQQFEYACHEGNYAMANMLSGSRADEKRTPDKAK